MSPEAIIEGLEPKIVPLEQFGEIRQGLRDAGETLVHCHGVFDLLHPGHVSHLQEARALGTRLVVTVTADRHVNKGPGRPVFSDDLRMSTLAALESVDWVIRSDHPTAREVIDVVQPDIYCKGREYEDHDADVTAQISSETATVERHGGEVRYMGGIVFSSTKLLNRHFDAIPAPAVSWAEEFAKRHDADDIRAIVESMAGLNVLVVGEVIIDEYIRCEIQGSTVKDHVPSVRKLGSDPYWGGSYAVARHLSSFCGGVTLAGIAGDDERLVAAEAPPGTPESIRREFETHPAFRTVVKQRFVVENPKRPELEKVFSVKELSQPEEIPESTRARFRERLAALMAEHDAIVLTDYGHGLIDAETQALIEDKAPYLALNCQTNSSNFGFNPITKYRRADSFCLDQTEIRIAYRDRGADQDALLLKLRESLGSSMGWLTLGSSGSLAVRARAASCARPRRCRCTSSTRSAPATRSSRSPACAPGSTSARPARSSATSRARSRRTCRATPSRSTRSTCSSSPRPS